uniref:C2H2-type domain-containing protein n=1 Tax=Junco hyemalis TaxID=40217 RepID=A0A8C5JVY4_JUNHY
LLPVLRNSKGLPPNNCEKCGKSFRKIHNHLCVEIRICDSYKCWTCEKSFSRRSHLIVHMRIHTGQQPYRCEECGMSFRDRSNLNHHRRTHTGARPYLCEQCGKSFPRGSHLSQDFGTSHILEVVLGYSPILGGFLRTAPWSPIARVVVLGTGSDREMMNGPRHLQCELEGQSKFCVGGVAAAPPQPLQPLVQPQSGCQARGTPKTPPERGTRCLGFLWSWSPCDWRC